MGVLKLSLPEWQAVKLTFFALAAEHSVKHKLGSIYDIVSV